MNSFRNQRLRNHALPMSTAWLFNDIAEAKGKQELFTRQSPQMLKALREAAIIQSAESSNRIEGVTVAPDRLRPLVLGNTKPRDRSEQEVQGYRRALNEIHTHHEKLPITPDTLKDLHALCQSASGDAGQFKRIDNEVIKLVPGAAPVVRFKCVTAMGTVIPAPAIGPCITALLCVRLGNSYGTAWAAWPTADKLLKKQAADRWVYYLEKILPGETRILEKLLDAKPQSQWITLSADVFNDDMGIKDKTVNDLVLASVAKDGKRISSALQRLIAAYYGKGKQQGV